MKIGVQEDMHPAATSLRRLWEGMRGNPTARAYVLVVVLFVVTSLFAHGFAAPAHVRFLLLTASFVGIAALGQTFVILGGGVDLSIPWTMNAAATLTTLLAAGNNHNLIWVLPIVFGIVLLIGLVNGATIALLHLSPIIMTLAMNVMIEGALLVYAGGTQTSNPPSAIVFLAEGDAGPIPMGVLIWVVLIVLATVGLSLTTFGRRLYAVGTNPVVARFAGLNLPAVQITTYVICSLSAGLAGLLLTGFVGQSYLGMGDPYLFASVAAVAIGGTSVLGGSGHYIGTVAGTLILSLVTGLLPIFNLGQGWLQAIYGLVIVLTVGLAAVRRKAEY